MEIDLTTRVLIAEKCSKYKIEQDFLKAIILTESGFNKYAVRYEPGYLWLYKTKELSEELLITHSTMVAAQKTSYGLCQVMGAVFFELGFRGYPGEFYRPEINIEYACMHLSNLRKRYGSNVSDLAASYNAGSVRLDSNKKYVNQRYVTFFMRKYENLKLERELRNQ